MFANIIYNIFKRKRRGEEDIRQYNYFRKIENLVLYYKCRKHGFQQME